MIIGNSKTRSSPTRYDVAKQYEKNDRLPSITMEGDLEQSLKVEIRDESIMASLEGINLVSYSKGFYDHSGKVVRLNYDGLSGNLFFNTDLFTSFNPKKNGNSDSNMNNLAKAFFKINGDNYVALVQYLKISGQSSEHYHSLDEFIIQLAGKSKIQMTSVKDESDTKTVNLDQGQMLKIPAYTVHRVIVPKESFSGSITLPIKKTNIKKSDRFKAPRATELINSDVEDILNSHFENGHEQTLALKRYYNSLDKIERKRFESRFGKFA